jgi:hypothetical protein
MHAALRTVHSNMVATLQTFSLRCMAGQGACQLGSASPTQLHAYLWQLPCFGVDCGPSIAVPGIILALVVNDLQGLGSGFSNAASCWEMRVLCTSNPYTCSASFCAGLTSDSLCMAVQNHGLDACLECCSSGCSTTSAC